MKTATSLLLLVPIVSIVSSACVKSQPPEADASAPSVASAKAAPSAVPTATSTGFNTAQCESLLIDAERTLASERSRAPSDCKKDDECQLVETSACIPACPDRAIAKKGVDAYMKTREQLRQSNCKLWNDAECPRTTPKPKPECPPMQAVCKAGHCDASPKTDAK